MTHVLLTIHTDKGELSFEGDYPTRKAANRAVAPTIAQCALMGVALSVDFKEQE